MKNPHTVHFASFFIATLAINLNFFQRGGQTRSRQCFFANRINSQAQITSRLNLEDFTEIVFYRNFWGFFVYAIQDAGVVRPPMVVRIISIMPAAPRARNNSAPNNSSTRHMDLGLTYLYFRSRDGDAAQDRRQACSTAETMLWERSWTSSKSNWGSCTSRGWTWASTSQLNFCFHKGSPQIPPIVKSPHLLQILLSIPCALHNSRSRFKSCSWISGTSTSDSSAGKAEWWKKVGGETHFHFILVYS